MTFFMGLYWPPFAEFSQESASMLLKSVSLAFK